MEQNAKTVLVLGATGHQGGAVARELLSKGFRVKAVTRKPGSDAARELSKLGAHVVNADISNSMTMSEALAGAWGVFAAFTMAESGVQWEKEQGIKFAEDAKKEGVEHFVYSSVSSADKATGIPHFESKRAIEEKVKRLRFSFTTIIRPVSFMENILSPMSLPALKKGMLMMGIDTARKQQVISVEDIGKFGALPFLEPGKTNRREIDIAGDELSPDEMAGILSKIKGKPIKAVPVHIEEIRKAMPDFAMMMEWINSTGYSVDIKALTEEYGIKPLTFEEWALKTIVN